MEYQKSINMVAPKTYIMVIKVGNVVVRRPFTSTKFQRPTKTWSLVAKMWAKKLGLKK